MEVISRELMVGILQQNLVSFLTLYPEFKMKILFIYISYIQLDG